MAKHDEVLIALRKIIRATDLYSRRLSKDVGLTAPQLLIMQAIKARGEMTMGDIAAEVSLSQATVTTILDRLEKRELLMRQRGDKDKRRVYASLTESGAALLVRAPTPLQEEFMEQFEGLHEWEQSLILSSLQRVATMMDAQDLDASPVLDVGAIDRYQTPLEFASASPELTPTQDSPNHARRTNHSKCNTNK
ncbi:MAG: MarR family transcriptional regulator [Gammaproteobacteria bacterium]|jgi:DNA-binding MarR family transcriptional regulator|nr:MarR family transcriptional regulator [Gammaproteobacteria bacterium]MBQ0775090.1 MarR family transcriptional regulator [Gammaproteobacteria bacterium]|tara:strand:+ start:98190 stop:98768 length:579 start_codon:yes stop_codon:yes gene_type:complete